MIQKQKKKADAPAARRVPSIATLGDVDLRLLRVFCTVVELGGFSGAQVKLGIGQSTISTHMAELETRLGMRLCRRGRSGFGLTQHGEIVYASCQKVFAALQDFRSEVSAVQGQLVGSLNIGLLDNTITDESNHLAEAIGKVNSRGAELQINLVVTAPAEIARAIKDGRLHVGISTAHHREPGLIYEHLYKERALLYCGRQHHMFGKTPYEIKLEHLRGCPYVSRGYEEERQRIQEKIDARPTALAYHLEGVATMIFSGGYIGIMPTHYAKAWVDQGLMRPIRPDILQNETAFFLISNRTSRGLPALKAFLQELNKVFPALKTAARAAPAVGSSAPGQ